MAARVTIRVSQREAYVLHQDQYTCQHCTGKSKDRRLHCHHLILRDKGGAMPPKISSCCVKRAMIGFTPGELR